MWADAQRDGRPDEYSESSVIPLCVPRRSLADARCCSAVQ